MTNQISYYIYFLWNLYFYLPDNVFRSRTPPGSAAAVQHLLSLAALFPATPWPPAWPHIPTLPVGSLTSWAYRAPVDTLDSLTWAACLAALLAWLQVSTHTISTWIPTANPPVLLLCVWKPKSTVLPFLGQHDAPMHAGWGILRKLGALNSKLCRKKWLPL